MVQFDVLFQRAKKRMLDTKQRFSFDWKQHEDSLAAFVRAHQNGELSDYLDKLKKDAAHWIDRKKAGLSSREK